MGEKIKKVREREEISSYERLKIAFELGTPDRVPVTPLVRECCLYWIGKRFIDAMVNPELYAFSQLHAVLRLGYDMVPDLSAIHAESEAMGSKLKIRENAPPTVEVPFVQDYKRDLPRLKIFDPYKKRTSLGTLSRLPMLLKIIRMEKAVCKEYGIPVVGYVQAPTRHACMLRGTESLLRDLKRHVDDAIELVDIATESLKVWGEAVIRAGSDFIMVSDPTSSGDVISRQDFERFTYPSVRNLIKFLRRCDSKIKVILHVCGDVNDRIDLMAKTGADGLSVDQEVDLARAKKIARDHNACIFGNIDPLHTMTFGTTEDVKRECVKTIKVVGRDGGFVLATGCGLPSIVPYENVKAMVDTAKTEGIYPIVAD